MAGTDLSVSTLGFGGAPIGFAEGAGHRRVEFLDLIRAAVDLGVSVFDTAPDYRASEALIGQALIGRRERAVVATKVGRVQRPNGDGWAVEEDWSPTAIERSVGESLARLGGEALDLVQLHSPPREVIERGEALAALRQEQARGRVRHIGISADGDDAFRALELGGFATLQTSYSLLQQQPGRDLLALAAANGVGVIAKQPLANAVMTMRERPAPADWIAKWEIARRMRWPVAAAEARLAWALRWVLSAPGVATAIVGTASPGNLRRNALMAEAPPLDAEAFAAGEAAFDAAELA